MKEKYLDDSRRMADLIIRTAEQIKTSKGLVLLFVHRSVDGDCIGSACGMAEVIRNIGADASVVLPDSLPENMDFLDLADLTIDLTGEKVDVSRFGCSFAVDCSVADRMGIAGELFDSCENTIIIDHHASVTERGENLWIEPDASSASELCYYAACQIADILGRPVNEIITPLAAKCFMMGIVTDTGRFTYSNTNPETLIASGELMELGGDISSVAYNMFDRKRKASVFVSSEAKLRSKFYYDDKLAVTTVPFELFEKYGAGSDSVDEVSGHLRDIKEVEVSVVLRKLSDGTVRGNVRSKSYFDAADFASLFGGGGHVRAAGFSITDGNLEEIADRVVKEAGNRL